MGRSPLSPPSRDVSSGFAHLIGYLLRRTEDEGIENHAISTQFEPPTVYLREVSVPVEYT